MVKFDSSSGKLLFTHKLIVDSKEYVSSDFALDLTDLDEVTRQIVIKVAKLSSSFASGRSPEAKVKDAPTLVEQLQKSLKRGAKEVVPSAPSSDDTVKGVEEVKAEKSAET